MKRELVFAGIAALVILGFLVFRPTGPKEPEYQGRRFSAWLNEYHQARWNGKRFSDPHATMQAAEQAIKAIGTNGIPTLLRLLQGNDLKRKEKLNALLDKQSLMHLRFERSSLQRGLAMSGFEILGSEAMPAGPALVQGLQSPDWSQRRYTLECLFLIDQNKKVLLPELVQAFHNSDPGIQRQTADYLHNHYPEEAEKVGVYQLYPAWKLSPQSAFETVSPRPPPTWKLRTPKGIETNSAVPK
jgi:hypothetical protein